MATSVQIQSNVSAIKGRLETVRRHFKDVSIGEWCGLGIAIVLPALALLFVLDNLLHMGLIPRAVLWLGVIGGVVYLVRRAALNIRIGASDEEVALRVERAFPELNNELINSLLLPKETGDEALHLVSEVVKSGNSDLSRVELDRAVPKQRLHRFGIAAAAAVLIMGLYAAIYPGYFWNAAQRMLVPVLPVDPLTMTRITDIKPGNVDVLSGEDVILTLATFARSGDDESDAVDSMARVHAVLDGRIPGVAEIGYRRGPNDWQIVRMNQKNLREGAEFEYRLRQVTQDTAYYIKAGDAKTERFTIHVHERPVIKDAVVTLEFPEFSGITEPQRQNRLNMQALAGTKVTIDGVASKPLKSAHLTFERSEPIEADLTGETTFATSFTVTENTTYTLDLVDASSKNFRNEPIYYKVSLVEDRRPTIDVLEPSESTIMVADDEVVAIEFVAADDYGVREATLMQYDDKQQAERSIKPWEAEDMFAKEFHQRFELDIAELKAEPGANLKLYIRARDWNENYGDSRTITIAVSSRREIEERADEQTRQAAMTLANIIELQERNLKDTRVVMLSGAREALTIEADPLKKLIAVQEEVRTMTGKVIQALRIDSPVRSTLETLFRNEMIVAVRLLRTVPDNGKNLDEAAQVESDIIGRLTARKETLAGSIDRFKMQDILAELDAIIAEQQAIRDATDARVQGGQWNADGLAYRQDSLADRIMQYKVRLEQHARDISQSDQSLGAKLYEAAELIPQRRIYNDMLAAGDKIANDAAGEALPIEDRILESLKAVRALMRDSIADMADKRLEELKEVIASASDKTEKLIELQRQITQLSEELKAPNDFSEDDNSDLKTQLGELKETREAMADVLEKMTKDLNIFPEIPVCNEIAQKTREVYEDIAQQPGSEEVTEATEMAVKRDDFALEALKQIEERIADVEMWLMDTPDSTSWKLENYGAEEIPEIPLVDLPEELEDLVGELLEQAEELQEEADDVASNFVFGDGEMGWDTDEGAMSNFSAKGKSGNKRPNTNEMTGRSGAGREGHATGELVEGTAKDLEGTPTDVRRTDDPAQAGEVAEENPDSVARATGGGKQSGVADERGFTGSSPPRNELGLREMERRQMEIKANTEKLYTQAVLLFLPTGELDNALLLMTKGQEALFKGDLHGFESLQRRVVHALQNTQRNVRGESSLELDPWLKIPDNIREEILNARGERVPPEFEAMVSEYYKAIAEAATE